MAHLIKLECGCRLPLLVISQTEPLDEAFTRAVMEYPTIVFLVKVDRPPMVAGRC
jgi:hypothetical protein